MYSQLTNINYNKSLGPVTDIRVNNAIIDGTLTVDGRDITDTSIIVNSSNVAIPNATIITGSVLTVNGVATFNYPLVGLTGSAPTVLCTVEDPILVPAVNGMWATVTSIGLTNCSASIFRVVAGNMELYNVSGVRISFMVIGSKVEV